MPALPLETLAEHAFLLILAGIGCAGLMLVGAGLGVVIGVLWDGPGRERKGGFRCPSR